MKVKDVDPGIRRLFPWALFLIVAALLVFAASEVRGADLDSDPYSCYGPGRYDAMRQGLGKEDCPKPKPFWAVWTCETLRVFMSDHTEAEARAKAIELHLPQWVIRKAEKCRHD